jgi:hypothetical protein
MGDTGDKLGYDLYDLSIVAKCNFPTVALDVHHAQQAIGATVGGEGVFNRPEHFVGGGGIGPAMTAWTELRETLIHVLTQTATSLDETADALNLAIKQYAATDQAASNRLNSLWGERGQPTPGKPA